VIEILNHSRRDRNYLDLALKLAATSDCTQQHGAVVVRSGRVLALGVNKDRNDPSVVPSDTGSSARGTIFSYHAEADALKRVRSPQGAVVYVARLGKTGPAYSRPCDGCAKLMRDLGIKAVYYT
jgi:deoxycytidylate deaminase